MRYAAKILLLLPWLITACGIKPEKPQGDWRCAALTPQCLALTGDYTRTERALFRQYYSGRYNLLRMSRRDQELRFTLAAVKAHFELRPRLVAMLRDDPKISISSNVGQIKIIKT